MAAIADQPDLAILTDPGAAAVLMHPVRQAVLGALRAGDSAAGVGRALGLPRQQVNYHLRELERFGLVQEVDQRRRGNCMERILRASASSWAISPQTLGDLDASPAQARDRFSWATLVHAAARVIRDLSTLRTRADAAGKHLATLTVESEVRIASPARLEEFRAACAEAVARIATHFDEPDAPDARAFRIVMASYPAITKTEAEALAESGRATTRELSSKETDHGTP